MSEHPTLTEVTADELVEEALRICDIGLAAITPSPLQRELVLRSATLRRALQQARRLERNEVQLQALRDLAFELHAEVTDLVARRASYRRLRVGSSPSSEDGPHGGRS